LLGDPLAALAASYLALVVSLAFRARAASALAAMVAVYAALAGGLVEALAATASWNDVRVLVFVALSLFLAGLLRVLGVLGALVGSSGCRLGMVAVPAAIGLVPMPGGALVSAVALRERYLVEARLSREWAVFLNYWFRHVWVPSWPLFQSVLITAAVFAVDPVEVIGVTWPATPAAIIAGLLVSWPILSRARCSARFEPARFAAALAPLAGIALLAAAGLPLLAALALVVSLVALLWRPSPGQLRAAAGLAATPRIHLVVVESLVFKNLLLATGAGEALVSAASTVPPALLAFALPFALGLAAGGENFFAATAMPVLAPLIAQGSTVNGLLLAVAYTGGFLGVMMSPVHLCLALTLEYYGARQGKVMVLVAAATATAAAAGVGLAYALHAQVGPLD